MVECQTIIIGGEREAVAAKCRKTGELVPAVFQLWQHAHNRAEVMGNEWGWSVARGGDGGWIVVRPLGNPIVPNGTDNAIDRLPETLASVPTFVFKPIDRSIPSNGAEVAELATKLFEAIHRLPASGRELVLSQCSRLVADCKRLNPDGTWVGGVH